MVGDAVATHAFFIAGVAAVAVCLIVVFFTFGHFCDSSMFSMRVRKVCSSMIGMLSFSALVFFDPGFFPITR